MSRFNIKKINNRKKKVLPALDYKKCLAKSSGTEVYTHCRIVAEVSREIIHRLPLSIRELLPSNSPLICALHDIGKVSPGFQAKYFYEHLKKYCRECTDIGGGFEENHAVISEAAVKAFLGNGATGLSKIVGVHHGKRKNPFSDTCEQYGGDNWALQRKKLIEKLSKDLEMSILRTQNLSGIQSRILSGLLCVSDWIGSDERYFPAGEKFREGKYPGYIKKVLDDCGWEETKIIKDLSFKNIFGYTPYPVQEDFESVFDSQGLYILEAPMGMGKTEAALFSAYKKLTEVSNTGIYFALPTRATSEKIHERVNSFLRKICSEKYPAKLIHGQAWLKAGGGELYPGHSWFSSRKRSLLAPFGVGTVDQALLSVMRVKHFFVRSFGLAGKVVILDEVHSYDIYTGTLLDELVRTLLEMRATVIILSATLTRERIGKLLGKDISRLSGAQKYPLILKKTRKDVFLKPGEQKIQQKRIGINFRSGEMQEVVSSVLRKARGGECVVWIANTVKKAQEYYRAVKGCLREEEFPVELIHSRFPAYRRIQLEDKWISKLGKRGERPKGCVLVATQVLEQSVDIDADFMISDLAPTDMLFQRIGRLWRHKRDKRVGQPEFDILSGKVQQAGNADELLELLGRANTRIYAPPVLWKTYTVWENRTEVKVPADMRELIEKTYKRDKSQEPFFVQELYEQLEKKKKSLRRKATAVMADVTSIPAMEDDENAATRYSNIVYTYCMVVLEVEKYKKHSILTLLDGKKVRVERGRSIYETARKIHNNMVPIPSYLFDKRKIETQNSAILRDYIYGKSVLLKKDEIGRLTYENQVTGLCYSDSLGVYEMNLISKGKL